MHKRGGRVHFLQEWPLIGSLAPVVGPSLVHTSTALRGLSSLKAENIYNSEGKVMGGMGKNWRGGNEGNWLKHVICMYESSKHKKVRKKQWEWRGMKDDD